MVEADTITAVAVAEVAEEAEEAKVGAAMDVAATHATTAACMATTSRSAATGSATRAQVLVPPESTNLTVEVEVIEVAGDSGAADRTIVVGTKDTKVHQARTTLGTSAL